MSRCRVGTLGEFALVWQGCSWIMFAHLALLPSFASAQEHEWHACTVKTRTLDKFVGSYTAAVNFDPKECHLPSRSEGMAKRVRRYSHVVVWYGTTSAVEEPPSGSR